jgi:hypothetical protein
VQGERLVRRDDEAASAAGHQQRRGQNRCRVWAGPAVRKQGHHGQPERCHRAPDHHQPTAHPVHETAADDGRSGRADREDQRGRRRLQGRVFQPLLEEHRDDQQPLAGSLSDSTSAALACAMPAALAAASELFLAGEVIVEAAAREARHLHQATPPVKSALAKELPRHLEDLFPVPLALCLGQPHGRKHGRGAGLPQLR